MPTHKCDQCEHETKRKGDLTAHKRVHSGEKPYKCDNCDYTCAQSGSLTTHKRTHTGKKPYSCDQCDFAGSQSSDLSKHKRQHLPNYVRLKKKKEDDLHAFLLSKDIKCEREVNISYRCMDSNKASSRLDFVVYHTDHVTVIECDESQHSCYEQVCEVARMNDVVQVMILNGDPRPIHWIRYNPDAFKVDSVTQRVPSVSRRKALLNAIDIKVVNTCISYLYYDRVLDKLAVESDEGYNDQFKELIVARVVN